MCSKLSVTSHSNPADPGPVDERQNIFRRLPGLHGALAADLLLEVWEEGGRAEG